MMTVVESTAETSHSWPGKKKKYNDKMSQLMRLWYLSHRRPAMAQASLHICTVSPEPSLFAHISMEVDEGSDQKSDI